MDIENKVLNYIEKHNLLDKNDTVICAVSGGADSVFMLEILNNLKNVFSLNLHVAHLNHQLRGEEADRDELFVATLSKRLGLPFHSKKVDVKALAFSEKISCEEAGRIARYEFFKELKTTLNADKIATAHNKNDNVETVLMRICRGTDIKGLSGIAPYNDFDVIRPIMCLTRDEIEFHLVCTGLEFVTDSSNLTDEYSRNKIRHHLLPLVENEFNASFVDTFSTNIELFKEANDFIEAIVNKEYNSISNIKHFGISFKLSDLLNNDSYIAKRIIKKVVYELTAANIPTSLVNLIYDALQSKKDVSINEKLSLYLKDSIAYFVKTRPTNEFTYNLSGFGKYYIPELSLSITIEKISEKVSFNDKNVLYLDGNIQPDFQLRSRKDGDRMYLLNCGTKKIKDILIDEKIPSFLKDEFPVLEYNGDIIWLCGLRDSGHLRAENNKTCIKISLHKENNYE